jgi:hypothetical protein
LAVLPLRLGRPIDRTSDRAPAGYVNRSRRSLTTNVVIANRMTPTP